MLALAKHNRRDGEVKVIDQSSTQLLSDGSHAATQSDIFAACRLLRLLECGFDSVGDETKLRSAFHGDSCPRIVGQDEDRRVVRRLIAPPAPPTLVGPWPPDRTEHVSPKNPRSDTLEALNGKIVIHAGFPVAVSVHLSERSCVKEPVEQLGPAHPKGGLQVLPRSGTESIDRNRECMYP
jgi:hypothetical protein